MIDHLLKRLVPAAALGLAVAGCNMNIDIGDTDGVPLAELDMSGTAPTEIVLAGPDNVIVTDGDVLDIAVEGDVEVVERLRFSNEDGTLAISRENGDWKDGGNATVRVTMPSPDTIVIAGSGTLEAQSVASEAEVTIAGSGKAKTTISSAKRHQVTVAGSGSYEAEGTTERLELTIAGSGGANMADLKADKAEITIAGSGNAAFASDGTVEASIVGSGDVNVTGSATCTVSSVGSGTVKCQTVTKEESATGES